MRASHAILMASSLFCLLAACSSGEPNDAGGGGTNNPAATSPSGTTPEAEPPLAPRALCATMAVGEAFGDGCSGSGSGDVVCALTDSRCGSDSCIYDSRDGETFAFYCAPKCTVGDAERCPLGYECVAESSSCGSKGKGAGVCARRSGSGCDEQAGIGDGTFFEGPSGELFHLAADYGTKRATLSVRKGRAFDEVSSWDGTGSNVLALVRSGDRLLLVTDDSEVLVQGGKATARKRVSASYGMAYGVAKDGSFVSLQSTGGAESFAALSRRGDDGLWTELGPTRQRVSKITSLTSGFLAVCQQTLCASADGEAFAPVALPAGVSFDDESTFSAVGSGIDDFYFTAAGGVYHHRKGAWVEEGPRAVPGTPDAGSSYPRPDRLRAFADGTVVFHTWNGNGYSTYVRGEDCWLSSTEGNLDNTDLVKGTDGNAFVWADTYDKALCTRPAR